MKRLNIKPGDKYNRLTIIEELPVRNKNRVFKCLCDCGTIKTVSISPLVHSRTVSCGCYRAEIKTKHGMWESREYSTWENMIQRCTNPKAKKYYLYGARGITVCERWLKSFAAFYEDMGTRPKNTTLDRIDPNKGYYKENCRWSNPHEQLANLSYFNAPLKNNGVTKLTEDWIKELNIDRNIFASRVARGLGYKVSLLGDVDIIVLDIKNNEQSIYHLNSFVKTHNFNRTKILELADTDHQEPYHGYLIRYLVGFKGWVDVK